jgi:hypothetical protein
MLKIGPTLIVLWALVSACGSQPRCVPGEARACACVDGATGAQSCRADGTFADCVCGAGGGAGGGGAATGGGGGTGADAGLCLGCSPDAVCAFDGGLAQCTCRPGTCGDGLTCHRDSNALLCANVDAGCGVISAVDSCGITRAARCGQCPDALVPAISDGGVGLVCIVGAVEPGNPGSTWAHERSRRFSSVQFQKALTDAGAPLPVVTLDLDLTDTPGAPVFALAGDAGGRFVAAIPLGGSTVAGGGLQAEGQISIEASGVVNRQSFSGLPSLTWYARCSGTADVTVETDALFCDGYGFNCGALTATDSTGGLRTVTSCGTCSGADVCRPGTTGYGNWKPLRCRACVAETDLQVCQRRGATCGSLTAEDNCGVVRTVNCGSCTSPAVCGGGGTANVCGGTAVRSAPLGCPNSYKFASCNGSASINLSP